MSNNKCLGFIETFGLAACVAAADAAVKSANVRLLGYEYAKGGGIGLIGVVALLIMIVVVVGLVVMMNEAERRIPVQYAKRVVGRKMYGGQSTHIPIKVASAGVIPVSYTHLTLPTNSLV